MSNKGKGILLIGCGGHSRFVLSILKNINYKIAGLIDITQNFNPKEVIMNTPVIGSSDNLNEFRKIGYKEVVLSIGSNAERKELYEKVITLDFILPNIVHSSAVIDDTASLGVGNVVGPNVVIGAEVNIGSNNIINSSAIIEHQSIIGNHSHISLSSTLCGSVKIGNEVFIGANSTINENLCIANNTLIGSGTNIIRNIFKTDLTLVGNPGRTSKK